RTAAAAVDPSAHEALDGVDGARRISRQATLSFTADVDHPIRGDRHNGWQERVTGTIVDHDWNAILHISDQAVGRAEIYASDFPHILSCRTPRDTTRGPRRESVYERSSASLPARRAYTS